MPDFILLMHRDGGPEPEAAWEAYVDRLRALGVFRGGSSVGHGKAVRRGAPAGPPADHLAGFIRVEADSLADALRLLAGNPAYEAGATVDVRELPED